MYDQSLRVDLRHELPKRPLKKGRDMYARRKGPDGKTAIWLRDPATIDTIALHQTATLLPPGAARIRAARGDLRLAQARRSLLIPAHATAFRDGFFATPCDLLAWAYHGHGLNPTSYACEIEGLYFGVVGDLRTLWGGKASDATPWNADVQRAAENAVGYMYEEGRRLGSPLAYYAAHRQSTAKPSDPGQEAWEAIGIGFCEKVLGLKPRYDLVMVDRSNRSGLPIPKQWDPRSPFPY